MNRDEFIRQQNAAVERMKEMNRRSVPGSSSQPMPPVPPFVRLQGSDSDNSENYFEKGFESKAQKNQSQKNTSKHKKGSSFLEELNLPFADIFLKESDISLIIGLLLILMSENSDKKLLFALIYILI